MNPGQIMAKETLSVDDQPTESVFTPGQAMAEETSHENLEDTQQTEFSSTDLAVDEMKPGLLYPDENTAVDAVLRWGEKALCPLAKARRHKSLAETNGHSKGRRHLECPHGRCRKGSNNEARPVQKVKYTKCPMKIVVAENDDSTWSVRKVVLDHFGHAGLLRQRAHQEAE